MTGGVPVNIPCLTGASVEGTTSPPCSGGHSGAQCPGLGTRCAVLYDEAGETVKHVVHVIILVTVCCGEAVTAGPGTSLWGNRRDSGGGTSQSSNTGKCLREGSQIESVEFSTQTGAGGESKLLSIIFINFLVANSNSSFYSH